MDAPTYSDAGFFLLRTPLLPFDWFAGWSVGTQLRTGTDDEAALIEAMRGDRAILRARLSALLDRPEVGRGRGRQRQLPSHRGVGTAGEQALDLGPLEPAPTAD